MTDKNLLRRIDRIEGILGDEPRPSELSPALREAVDMIVRRGEPSLKDLRETEKKAVQPHFQQQPDKFSSGLQDALQASIDWLLKRVSNAEKVSEDSRGGNE